MSEILFSDTYHQARARFLEATGAFEAHTGRTATRHRLLVDAADDLSVDVAEWLPPTMERLFVAVAGLHGLEGYTGSAILLEMLGGALRRVDLDRCGIALFHAVNPWGFHHSRRVNQDNIDLNRNFQIPGESLYGADSTGYESLEHILNPATPFRGTAGEQLSFYLQALTALLMRGMGPLRQATLSGQYTRPAGVFWGGAAPAAETRFFGEHLGRLAAASPEILLTDIHTGYGGRAKVSPLFPQADSPDFAAWVSRGVRDERGADQTYTARGELVRFSHEEARRRRPGLVFNGVVVEVGTQGLGVTDQFESLRRMVRENQVQHHGAATPAVAARARAEFRELFYPSDPAWRAEVAREVPSLIEGFLRLRGFLGA